MFVACDAWKRDPQGSAPMRAADDEVSAAAPAVGANNGDTGGQTGGRPDPAAPSGEPPAFEPAEALGGLLGEGRLEATDDGLGEMLEPVDHAGVFASKAGKVGAAWFQVTVDDAPVAALFHAEPAKDFYEVHLVKATVFTVRDGAWTAGKTLPFHEDAPGDYATLPETLDLGAGVTGLVHAPAIQGCGAAPCKPSDDYVATTVHEITSTGLVERARFEGPGCSVGEGEPAMAGCKVQVEGADASTRGALVFRAKDSPSAKLVTRRFEFSDDAYAVE